MYSVIIATYNGSEFIIEQLNSIINQSKKIDKIYIYDDCSTDNTIDLIQFWIQKNHLYNVIIKSNAKNKGYTQNFLDALNEVEGDYIFLCDQDDVWQQNKLEEYLRILEKSENSNKPLLVTSGYSVCDEKLNVIRNCHISKKSEDIRKVNLQSFIKDCSYPGMTFCVNRNLIEIARNKANYKCIKYHDYFLSILAIQHGDMIIIPESLVLYRQHGNNVLGVSGNNNKTRNHWKKNLEQKEAEISILEYCNVDSNLFEKKKEFLNKRMFFFHHKNIISIMLNFFSYIKYFNVKSFLGDLYFSVKRN